VASSRDNGKLVRTRDGELLQIEPWGPDSLRVRVTARASLEQANDWALLPAGPSAAIVQADAEDTSITNGRITARLSAGGQISFFNARGSLVLEERWRTRAARGESFNATEVPGRELRPLQGGSFRATTRFEARDGEKIFGMGQYQDGLLNMKGAILELAQRNSQVSIPFCISSHGYGFLWNNPAIGRAVFAANMTEWVAEVTTGLDYWVTVGDTPAEIEEHYASVTGTSPMMPDFAMGFWQCKLRYKTQDELLSVAREYRKRGLPLSVIVADFFHWPMQGDWRFDTRAWPDPAAMVKELKGMGVELMVSVWPTVDRRSENFKAMRDAGYLVRSEHGVRTTMEFMGDTVFFDPTNPGARDFVWKAIKKGYYDHGVRLFWLDVAEPEYAVYDFDNYRYHLGSVMEVGNLYPAAYTRTVFDGMRAAGHTEIISLVRCAWAGSQRYGALVWSGDITPTWGSFRRQFAAGLNMGLSGIPWWTSDIGGFEGGNPDDPAYRELLIRWFQWGTFCPVFRLHGFREGSSLPPGVGQPPGSSSDDVVTGGPN
jgi:alpha-D-xyloside xylohydrolase